MIQAAAGGDRAETPCAGSGVGGGRSLSHVAGAQIGAGGGTTTIFGMIASGKRSAGAEITIPSTASVGVLIRMMQ